MKIVWKAVPHYLGITLGTVFVALGLVLFLVPNKIAAGGVSGIATITYYLFKIPVGWMILALNVPLFLFGIRELGLPFGIRSLFGTITLSFFVEMFSLWLKPLTHDLLLAAIYGGILTGLGMGIVFRAKGTTGGTDLAARLIHKYTRISLGQSLLSIDFLVIATAGVVFDAELAMYALLSLFVTSQVIDLVQEGKGYAKAAFIISPATEQITQAIFHQLDRGATALKGRGLYTGQDREIIFCVVTQSEETKLKDLVYQIDPQAFVIVSDVHEVLGEGFKKRGG
ncbi:MAG: YitT family protein [Firmicutes bacterium]|nr:YitT family protein [Bacillota bacterium]